MSGEATTTDDSHLFRGREDLRTQRQQSLRLAELQTLHIKSKSSPGQHQGVSGGLNCLFLAVLPVVAALYSDCHYMAPLNAGIINQPLEPGLCAAVRVCTQFIFSSIIM